MRETNASKILTVLRDASGPLCDDCAADLCGFKHRQVAYQQAELLSGRSQIYRAKDRQCMRCGTEKKCSWLGDDRDSKEILRSPVEEVTDMTNALVFEEFARDAASRHYGMPLLQRAAGDVPKIFDFVSPDESVIGDAKFYSLVNGKSPPPAKFATIAEHVWMLEKIPAEHRFLVFGNDRRVPEMWLRRYGHLANGVMFYFLGSDGILEVLGS